MVYVIFGKFRTPGWQRAMSPLDFNLEPGRVYRTQDLALWSSNAPRLAKRLVKAGRLVQLRHGLYAHPKLSRFGAVPPRDEELMRAFLKGGRFVFTGPERWNALGLGATAVFSTALVYNTKRSGEVELGGRRYALRRVAFPREPSPEWFAVDLLENADRAGVSPDDVATSLATAVSRGEFDLERLWAMAREYGTDRTRNLLSQKLPRAAA